MSIQIPVVRDHTIPLGSYPHLNETQTLRDAAKVIHSFTTGESGHIRYRWLSMEKISWSAR